MREFKYRAIFNKMLKNGLKMTKPVKNCENGLILTKTRRVREFMYRANYMVREL